MIAVPLFIKTKRIQIYCAKSGRNGKESRKKFRKKVVSELVFSVSDTIC